MEKLPGNLQTGKRCTDDSSVNELAKHDRVELKTEKVLVERNFLAWKTEAGCPPKDLLSVHNQ